MKVKEEMECSMESYFYLCQQFIHYNIKDDILKKNLIFQLTNYVNDFPQDLGILYNIWVKTYPIEKTDIFDIKVISKKKNEMDNTTSSPTKKQIHFWKSSSS